VSGSSIKPSIFISYAHMDEPGTAALDAVQWLSFVIGYLRPADAQGKIEVWVDDVLRGGDDWDLEINRKLKACDVFILLVSRHSLASEYILKTEIEAIRKRQENGEDVRCYPLLLTTTPKYALDPVRDWNIRPKNLEPLSSYPQSERERQMSAAADEIIEIAKEIASHKSIAPEPPPPAPVAPAGPKEADEIEPLARAATPAPQPFNLPFPSLGPLFVGREEALDTLHAALAGKQTVGVALNGLGGVGKTRLAIEYALAHAAHYSALLFARAGDAATLNSSLAALAGADILDLPEKDAHEGSAQVAGVLRWLAAHPTWLMILDNVDDEKAVAAVANLIARLRNGHVIVTARATMLPAALRKLELGVLDEDSATRFLLERTDGGRAKTSDDEAKARELAREFDGLALALEQAGAYIATERIGFARYLKLWSESRDKLLAWSDPTLTGAERTLATTWATSIEKLSPESRRLLDRIAMLSAHSIPDSLIDVAVPGEAADYDTERARGGLFRYSLITRATGDDGAAKGFVVHRLVQDFAYRTMSDERRTQALREALEWVNASFVDDPEDVRRWPILNPLAPHARVVALRADEAGIAEPTTRLFNNLGLLLKTKARYAEAEPFMRRALAIDDAIYGPDHPDVAKDLSNLAFLLKDTKRPDEAERMFRRALKIRKAHPGPDHPEVATDLNNLAFLLKDTKRPDEAERMFRRALKIHKAHYGPDHPEVATDLNNLAFLLKDTKRLDEAERMFRRALKIHKAHYGPDHPEVATDLCNLASVLKTMNRLSEAEPLYRDALKIDEASLGPEHPKVARDLNNLANLLLKAKRPNQAEPLMRRALAIFEKSLGPDHPDTADVRAHLAALLAARGQET